MEQHSDIFAQARQEKRTVFSQNWDPFMSSRRLFLSLLLVSIQFVVLIVFSYQFLYDNAIAMGLLGKNHAVWCYVAVAGVQLLLCIPGCMALIGLWRLRTEARWGQGHAPKLSGLRLIRLANVLVCIFGGVTLALYPTVIISAGEYVSENALTRIFYLFLAITLLFLVCICLLRVVLRHAEENISCGWANTRLLLPLILSGVAGSVVLFGHLESPFHIAAAGLCLGCCLVLGLYWHILLRIRKQQENIDAKAVSDRRGSYDDPYTRY